MAFNVYGRGGSILRMGWIAFQNVCIRMPIGDSAIGRSANTGRDNMTRLISAKVETASKQDMGKAMEGLCSCGAELQDCDMGGYCNECDTVWVYKEIA